MTKERRDRLIGFAASVFAGLTVQFLVRQPLMAVATFLTGLLLTLIFVARGLPVRVSLDRTHRVLFGAAGYYCDQAAARPQIIAVAHASKRVDIMLIRGHNFILDEDALLAAILDGTQNMHIRLLLLNPDGAAMTNYLRIRNFSADEQRQYLAKCALVRDCLDGLRGRFTLEYRYYDHFPSWKVIVADSHAFVAPYDTRTRGSKLPYVAYSGMGRPFFVAFSNHFDVVWERFSVTPD